MKRKKPMDGKERYGWSVARIIDGYVQHINAVHRTRPAGLGKPGPDSTNAPKQCYDFVCARPDYDAALVDRVLGEPEELPETDWLAFLYFRKGLEDHLREEPWEPADRAQEEPKAVEFVKLSVAAIGNGISDQTLLNWIGLGMPHRKSGNAYYVQLSVVERWKKMKYRHKVRRHLTKVRK